MLHRRRMSRPRRLTGRGHTLLERIQRRGDLILLLTAILLLPVCLFLIPKYWITRNRTEYVRTWSASSLNYAARIMNQISEPPDVHDLRTGDEPGVREALRKTPLVVAIGMPDKGEIWIREGDHLRPGGSDRVSEVFRRWVRLAQASGTSVWNPSPSEHPAYLTEAISVMKQPIGFVVCRWRMGSPEVERFLRLTLGENPGFRVGLLRADPKERPARNALPWTQPDIQVDLPKDIPYELLEGIVMDLLGENWRIAIVGSAQDEAQIARLLLVWRIQAYGLCAVLFLSMGAGFYFLQRARRREHLDRDRMASMAHSLKTPLGILMLRCDSIRLGRFEPIRTELELARICEEVEHLTAFIDQSLKGLRRSEPKLSPERISPQWFQDLVDDLSLAFEDEARPFSIQLDATSAQAHAPSLRTALVTMLENALNHGTGLVALQTKRKGKWLRVEVQDGGPGLNPDQLGLLGRPFMRFRTQGSEGFEREGQGLGLFLLTQMADQEGWGLEFASGSGSGFTVALEIPTAWGRLNTAATTRR